MPRKKNPNNNYFNESVEEAIHAFNLSTDEREKNKLFSIIYPALAKISEVWYNKIKPVYAVLEGEELQLDCITFLLEKMHMVKRGKGKAFSYLTVTARNYYIQENMRGYSKRLKGYSLEAMPESFDIPDIPSHRAEQMEWNGTLFDTFLEYIEENFDTMFTQKKQKQFGIVLLRKLRESSLSSDFNRRKMLNELADEIDMERGIVTKHINRVAGFYSTFKTHFETYGAKPMFKEKLSLTESDKEYIRKNYEHYSKSNGINGISRKLGIKYDILKRWIEKEFI